MVVNKATRKRKAVSTETGRRRKSRRRQLTELVLLTYYYADNLRNFPIDRVLERQKEMDIPYLKKVLPKQCFAENISDLRNITHQEMRHIERAIEEISPPDPDVALPETGEYRKLIDRLKIDLGLSPLQVRIVEFILITSLHSGVFRKLCGRMLVSISREFALIAYLCNTSRSGIFQEFSFSGLLVRMQVIERQSGHPENDLEDHFGFAREIETWFTQCQADIPPPLGFDAVSATPRLTISDFKYMESHVNLANMLIRNALHRHVSGINILLYGVPGTGKTQLALALAAACNAKLYEVSMQISSGAPCSSGERINALCAAQRVLAHSPGRSLILFDEVEDAVSSSPTQPFGRRSSGIDLTTSKAWTNAMLESNPVPVIWIANSVNDFEASWIRRFSLIIHINPPPRDVRKTIIDKALHEFPTSHHFRDALAKVETVSPGLLSVAVKTLVTAGSLTEAAKNDSSLCCILDAPLRMFGARPLAMRRTPYDDFDLNLLNPKGNAVVTKVLRNLLQASEGRVLLSGPPGCGKTGFANFVATQQGIPLIRRTPSDLLSKWVGESEEKIAEMFRSAEKDKAVLLVDEFDGLLTNRDSLSAQWQVNIVNEFLARIEEFTGILFCCTNRLRILDPALMRRFLFRVEFDYLRLDQQMVLMKRCMQTMRSAMNVVEPEKLSCYESEYAERRLMNCRRLTPADFHLVMDRYLYLQQPPTVDEFVHDLIAEEQGKLDEHEKVMGFQ